MLIWKNAQEDDIDLLNKISLLFSNNSKLLEFMFDLDKSRLRASSKEILYESGVFSSGEQILIQVALDIWDGSGQTGMLDLFEKLDLVHTRKILKIFGVLE